MEWHQTDDIVVGWAMGWEEMDEADAFKALEHPAHGRAVGPLVRRTMSQGARSSEAQTENTLQRNGARLGAGDQAVLQNPEVRRLLAQTAVESYRQGVEGNVEQALLLTRNWGSPLATINGARLSLWHGMQDRIMPVAPARLLTQALPQYQAQFYPDTGYLSTLITHAPDILQTLVAAWDSAPEQHAQANVSETDSHAHGDSDLSN